MSDDVAGSGACGGTMRDDDIRRRLEIDDNELAIWMERIRPVVRFDVHGYERPLIPGPRNDVGIPFWIKRCEPRRVAYTWEPDPTEEALVCQAGHIITYHRFGAPSLFKPSIAEVLAQLRYAERHAELDLSGIIAFETGNGDLTSTNVYCGQEDSWHWCPTILYSEPR